MDWNPFDWFKETEQTSRNDISLVTPFGKFKDRCSFLNFCHNRWQSLDGVYYYPDFNDFRYFTTKLLELGGICEYKEHHNNDIYKMFIKPNCSNSVKIVYFGKKDDSNMNASKRLRKDEHKLNTAQSTIKNVKQDIKQVRNQSKHSQRWLVLCLYDNIASKDWDNICKYNKFYVVVNSDYKGHYHISNAMDYYGVLNDDYIWLDKPIAKHIFLRLSNYVDNCCCPKMMTKQAFKSEFDPK